MLSSATVTCVRRATCGEALQFGLADDREGHQQVGGLGGQHDFGFGDLGDGQPRGAGGNLPFGDAHRFVGLGVGPQAQAVLARVVRDARQVALEDIEIDHQRRRVNFRNVHIRRGLPNRRWR